MRGRVYRWALALALVTASAVPAKPAQAQNPTYCYGGWEEQEYDAINGSFVTVALLWVGLWLVL